MVAGSVRIRNAGSLTHAMAHHAKDLEPIVGCLALQFLVRLQPLGWRLEQSGTGAQSYAIRKGPLQYHLRGIKEGREPGYDAILVKDAWHRGKEVAVLRGRVDVIRFVDDRVAES